MYIFLLHGILFNLLLLPNLILFVIIKTKCNVVLNIFEF